MIETILKLCCDQCNALISRLKNEGEKRDYIHAEGYEKDNIEFFRFNVFCSQECKKQFYEVLKASKVIDWV